MIIIMTPKTAAQIASRANGELFERGIGALETMLPQAWKIRRVDRPLHDDSGHDAVITVTEPGGSESEVSVMVESAVTPREAQKLVARLALIRQAGMTETFLVLAPWLGARARDVLDHHGVSYLDLTGNAFLRLDSPAVLISTTGAQKDPTPAPRRDGVTVRGDAAGRVVRFLVDVAPPHTTTSLAVGAGVSLPHASRVLTALDREALVQRGRRGVVVDVDWQGLLRRRAESYSVFTTNVAHGYVSPTGARRAMEDLRRKAPPPHLAVTGSFAAVQRAPVAAPGQLVIYVEDPEQTAGAMGLLPTDRGADVVLLRPRDQAVLVRSETVEGLRVVAPSQLVLDSLSGNGRMPAEGEALLTWMADHLERWRSPSIDDATVQEGLR